MSSKLSRMSNAFWVEGRKRLRWIIIIGVVLFAYAAVQPYFVTRKNSQAVDKNTAQTLQNTKAIKVNTDAIAAAVKNIKANNDNQTLLLCKLILSNSPQFNPADIATVETICKEKINQAYDTSTSQGSSAATSTPQSSQASGASSGNVSSSPSSNHNQNPGPPQPNPKQPVKVLGVPACIPFLQVCVDR